MKKIYTLLIVIPVLSYGQWTELSIPPVSNPLESVYFLDDSVGYSIGSDAFKSTDGGWTWQPATGDYAIFSKACFIDSLNGFAYNDTELFQSNDGGASWSNISDSVEITEFYHLEERNGHIIINGRNPAHGYYWYVSPNGGQSWEMRDFHTDKPPIISYVLDEDHYYVYSNQWLFATNDGGATWDSAFHRVYCDVGDEHLSAIYFTSPDTGFIGYYYTLNQGGRIEKTYTGIHNFQREIFQIDPTVKQGVNFINGKGNTICCGGYGGHLYCSPDRGVHWFAQSVNTNGTSMSLWDSYFWSDSRIAVVGNSGRVLLTDSGIYHSMQTKSNFITEVVSVFPNPSSGSFTIENLSTSENAWTMTLTNTAGQILLVQSFKNSVETIDISHLPNGVYLIQLKSDRGYVTKQVIKN